jgi:hypothetical protein
MRGESKVPNMYSWSYDSWEETNGTEKDLNAENFPGLVKDINLQIEEE